MRKLITLFIGCLAFVGSYAQEEGKWGHYFGIQANPVLQQVLSFGNAAPVNNPFLVKYSLRPAKIPFELNVGAGVSYNSTEDDKGFVNQFSATNGRIGIAYKKQIGEKFEYGAGLDAVIRFEDNTTATVTTLNFPGGINPIIDSTVAITRSTDRNLGGGIQLNFAYKITPKIHIGSEATYYFLSGTEKINVETARYHNNFGNTALIKQTTTFNEKRDGQDLSLNLPIAVFLIFRL